MPLCDLFVYLQARLTSGKKRFFFTSLETMLINPLNTDPSQITFSQVIEYIENQYLFTPTAFKNGDSHNSANQNNGSCKIFFFAQMHQLSEQQTLQLFGDYYRKDVLQNPDATDHQNIRNFMKFGWQGIQFEGTALHPKPAFCEE